MRLAAALVSLLVACGGGVGASVDAGMTSDAGPPLPGAQVGAHGTTLQEVDPATARPADYGCLLSGPGPVGLWDTTFQMRIADFVTPTDGAGGIGVCVYPGSTIPGLACEPPDRIVTDANGWLTVHARYPGLLAVEVLPGIDLAGHDRRRTTAYGVFAQNGGTQSQNISFQSNVFDLVPVLLHVANVPGTAFIGGSVLDCNDDVVHGAHARLARPDGTYLEEVNGLVYAYADGTRTPVGGRTFTHVDGLFGVVNVPVDASELLVEITALIAPETTPRVVSCARVLVAADGFTTTQMRPLRTDDPPCPGLAAP